jgi:hypothetical protein
MVSETTPTTKISCPKISSFRYPSVCAEYIHRREEAATAEKHLVLTLACRPKKSAHVRPMASEEVALGHRTEDGRRDEADDERTEHGLEEDGILDLA